MSTCMFSSFCSNLQPMPRRRLRVSPQVRLPPPLLFPAFCRTSTSKSRRFLQQRQRRRRQVVTATSRPPTNMVTIIHLILASPAIHRSLLHRCRLRLLSHLRCPRPPLRRTCRLHFLQAQQPPSCHSGRPHTMPA